MTQDIAEPGSPEPGPDTFDFEAWLDDKSTFPVFDHTAYVDQRSGSELARVYEEIEELVSEQTDLEKRIEARTQKPTNAFVDGLLDSMLDEREKIDVSLQELLERSDALKEKIRASSLTLVFQVKTPEEMGSITREATREFHKTSKQYAKGGNEDDLDYITARSRYLLTAQIAHFCTGMKMPDGREVPSPSRQGAEKLLASLITSEMLRLMESVATGLSASQDWADKLDAGFPGRGADVEDVELDQDGAEDGEVVGSSTLDDADRQALGLG